VLRTHKNVTTGPSSDVRDWTVDNEGHAYSGVYCVRW